MPVGFLNLDPGALAVGPGAARPVPAAEPAWERALGMFAEHLIRDALDRSATPYEAARTLAVHYKTLWRKAKKYNIVLQI
jgi:transcriptional regulator with PAS, ATPase and Fis domain